MGGGTGCMHRVCVEKAQDACEAHVGWCGEGAQACFRMGTELMYDTILLAVPVSKPCSSLICAKEGSDEAV